MYCSRYLISYLEFEFYYCFIEEVLLFLMEYNDIKIQNVQYSTNFTILSMLPIYKITN